MEILRSGYFWETMSKDVHEFVRACHLCQQVNAPTTKPAGPLHGYDYLLTITDRLTGFIELVPCSTTINARDLAILVWDRWVSHYGLPLSITSDHDTLFTSLFWTTLWEKQNVKLKMSTAFL
ncbi:hypothetical protein LQV05_001123 [Cryptococcus neoformans]|nr:hypothetical protein LQV05_001123 [Cryptococcus neoformans]